MTPRGYAAYARVLHPVEDQLGARTRGDHVCAELGRTPHAVMQWSAVAGNAWPDAQPDEGNLHPTTLGELCRVVIDRTTVQQGFFALWEGWGWVDGRGSMWWSNGDEVGRPGPSAYPVGPLTESPVFINPHGPRPQSPSLFWPADRSWCVATEIDFDSTIVACSAELVAAVLASPGLEAWPVGPDDSLALVSPEGGTAPSG